ncbi:MAG: glycosyltransferase family 4 protein [Vulcanimicrobiaceae bacterium]
MTTIVCFYSGTVGPRAIAGGDRHGLEVWSAWSKRTDCAVNVLTSYWGRDLIETFGYPLRTQTVETRGVTIGPSRLRYIERFFGAMRMALRAGSCGVVYSASAYFYDLIAAICLKLRNRGSTLIVSVFHLIPPPWERTGSVAVNTLAWIEQRVMLAFLKVFADKVIVDNADLVRDFVRLGVPEGRIVLSSMGVPDLPDGDAVVQDKTYDAIYVGRLAVPKGVRGLIRAWSDVVSTIPTAKLALVGSTEDGFDAQVLVDALQLRDNVEIISGLSDVEVRRRLMRSRTFITGSLEEGYGLSVLEALAAGLPCITFDLPAFRYAFPVGRYAAASFDYADLAKAAIELIGNEQLRRAIAEEIRAKVVVKSWRTVADELWSSCVAKA